MYLLCNRTKETKYLKDEQVEFIKLLLTKLDIDRKYRIFDQRELTQPICWESSKLIMAHIDKGKIFQQVIKGKCVPILKLDKLDRNKDVEPLSMVWL